MRNDGRGKVCLDLSENNHAFANLVSAGVLEDVFHYVGSIDKW
jgi:hypothetical protein